MRRAVCVVVAFACTASCRTGETSKRVDISGSWRAVLTSPGGPLPFELEIAEPKQQPPAVFVNGDARTPAAAVEVSDRQVVIRIGEGDARIEAQAAADGRRMSGTWHGGKSETLPFVAVYGDTKRFALVANARAPIQTVGGRWDVELSDTNGAVSGSVDMTEERDGRVLGEFRTPSGEYRNLEGVYRGGKLRLSLFDGVVAVLLTATAGDDGTLRGQLWSGASYQATWTARRARRESP